MLASIGPYRAQCYRRSCAATTWEMIRIRSYNSTSLGLVSKHLDVLLEDNPRTAQHRKFTAPSDFTSTAGRLAWHCSPNRASQINLETTDAKSLAQALLR